MIQMNIRSGKYSNIFEYPNIHHSVCKVIKIMPLGLQKVCLVFKKNGIVKNVLPWIFNFLGAAEEGSPSLCFSDSNPFKWEN